MSGNDRSVMTVKHKLVLLVVAALTGLLALSAIALAVEKKLLLEDRKVKTRNVVETAYGVLEAFHARQVAGQLSEAEARQGALETVRKLRYENNDYFWINDLQPMVIMHPLKPELDGKDVSGLKDPNGKALFVEFANVARQRGSGFVDYLWPMPGASEPVPKTSYVKMFTPWGWVIGSGIYLDDIDRIFMREVSVMAGVVLVGLTILGLLAGFLARSIIRPLAALESSIVRIEQSSDLTERVAIERNDELGRTAQSFNRMIAAFQETLHSVADNARQVSDASHQLSGMAGNMDSRTGLQSEAVSAMAATIEEMNASIEHLSGNAVEAHQMAVKSGELSGQGHVVVSQAATEMKRIADAVDQSTSFIVELGQHSTQISVIVHTIKEIADQTNLLALNAAIEAARAGEHGRGFAVVADEVRKLAERTSHSTGEISAMIDSIQTGTVNAVASMEEGNAFVHEGVAMTSRAGESMLHIRDEAQRVEMVVTDISNALREQSVASGQVAHSAEMIAETTHDASEEAHRIAIASDDLAQLAGGLQTVVARFKV